LASNGQGVFHALRNSCVTRSECKETHRLIVRRHID
jgi:hypothetical protein